jgi:hypothetical protein
MKSLLSFLIMLLFFIPSFAQNRAKLVTEGNRWNEYEYITGDTTYQVHRYEIKGDTVIGETIYLKVFRNGIYDAALRENADTVFIFYGYNDIHEEKVLYNFNWKIGDSICHDLVYEDFIFCDKKIEEFDSILLEDGLYYNIQRVFDAYMYINGIGMTHRLIHNLLPYPCCASTALICFWSGVQLIYFDRYFDSCEGGHTSAIITPSKPSTTIVKQTSENTILLIFENLPARDFMISVYGVNGKRERNIHVKDQYLLDIGKFLPGIYFFSITGPRGELYDSGKFIIAY